MKQKTFSWSATSEQTDLESYINSLIRRAYQIDHVIPVRYANGEVLVEAVIIAHKLGQ